MNADKLQEICAKSVANVRIGCAKGNAKPAPLDYWIAAEVIKIVRSRGTSVTSEGTPEKKQRLISRSTKIPF